MVLIPGGQKAIEQLKVGDWVQTWDTDEQRLVSSQVTRTLKHYSQQTFWLVTGGGIVVTTPGHNFWTGQDWVAAKDLKPGTSYVVDNNGNRQKVLFSMYGSKQDVYNLHVASDNHNYIANGYVVHNLIKE